MFISRCESTTSSSFFALYKTYLLEKEKKKRRMFRPIYIGIKFKMFGVTLMYSHLPEGASKKQKKKEICY